MKDRKPRKHGETGADGTFEQMTSHQRFEWVQRKNRNFIDITDGFFVHGDGEESATIGFSEVTKIFLHQQKSMVRRKIMFSLIKNDGGSLDITAGRHAFEDETILTEFQKAVLAILREIQKVNPDVEAFASSRLKPKDQILFYLTLSLTYPVAYYAIWLKLSANPQYAVISYFFTTMTLVGCIFAMNIKHKSDISALIDSLRNP